MLFGFSASGSIEVGVLYAFSYLGRLNEPLIELTAAVDAASGGGGRARV